jgi:single-strand DNA-binding protein
MYQLLTIIGNIGREPELKQLPSGTAVCNLTVACNETWTDKQTGERKEKVVWFRLAFYGRSAENAAQYCKKGERLFATGTVEARAFMGEDGEPRASLELRVGAWKLLGGKAERSEQDGDSEYAYEPSPKEIDDIPF